MVPAMPPTDTDMLPTTDDPWTVYWHANHLDSCIAAASEADARAISEFWKTFALELAEDATVLDLATGNGAVPGRLLSADRALRITAVDRAAIDPLAYLEDVPALAGVNFVGHVDICTLPFEPGSFDAVTSQFGIEYAPLADAADAAVRVLKRGGLMRMLLHHADSEIVRPAADRQAEIGRLLADNGVIHALHAYVHGNIPLEQLEQAGQEYLNSDSRRTAPISGQVFAGINRIITDIADDPQAAVLLAAGMTQRLTAEWARLEQMRQAALTPDQTDQLRQQLEQAGVEVKLLDPFSIGESADTRALIGWHLSGRKR